MAESDKGDVNRTVLKAFAPLTQVFKASPLAEHGKKWDSLWEKGELLPWDRGTPNPALVDVLQTRGDLVSSAVDENGNRRKALVPGCGRGYDVLLLASLGYDAYGLEISENALKAAKALSQSQFEQYVETYAAEGGQGQFDFLSGDFFKDDWLQGVTSPDGGFDIIYDYTFLCALPPDARPAWSKRMSQLLSSKSGASLVCLEFPSFKDPALGGPPFGLNAHVYEAHLGNPGVQIPYTPEGFPQSTQAPEGSKPEASPLKRVARWQPERTHEVGKGTDWISVWQH